MPSEYKVNRKREDKQDICCENMIFHYNRILGEYESLICSSRTW